MFVLHIVVLAIVHRILNSTSASHPKCTNASQFWWLCVKWILWMSTNNVWLNLKSMWNSDRKLSKSRQAGLSTAKITTRPYVLEPECSGLSCFRNSEFSEQKPKGRNIYKINICLWDWSYLQHRLENNGDTCQPKKRAKRICAKQGHGNRYGMDTNAFDEVDAITFSYLYNASDWGCRAFGIDI